MLKFFLAQRGLNETFTGGVGSFLLQLMVVSFLQQRYRTDRATGFASAPNLGALLLELLELYGRDFNYAVTGISVRRNGAYFPKRERGWQYRRPRRNLPSPRNIHVVAAASPRPVPTRNIHVAAAASPRPVFTRNVRVAAAASPRPVSCGYSRHLTRSPHGISTSWPRRRRDPSPVDTHVHLAPTRYPSRPNLIAVENPDDTSFDVGKNSYNIGRVKRAFEHAHQRLVVAAAADDWRETCLLGKALDLGVLNDRVAAVGDL